MRSISSTGKSWNAVRPALAEPTLMPSISTSTWSDSVPRRNSVVFLPKPPLFASDTPGTWRNSSGTLRAWLRSISSRSMTLTAARLWEAVWTVRVAVTTWSARLTGSARLREDAPHSATAAGVRKTLFMLCAAPSLSPARPGLRQTEDEATAGDVRQRPPRCRGCVRPVSGLASEALDASSRAFPCRSTVVIERLSDSPTVAGAALAWFRRNAPASLFHPLRGTCRKARSLVVRGLRGQCGRAPQN